MKVRVYATAVLAAVIALSIYCGLQIGVFQERDRTYLIFQPADVAMCKQLRRRCVVMTPEQLQHFYLKAYGAGKSEMQHSDGWGMPWLDKNFFQRGA